MPVRRPVMQTSLRWAGRAHEWLRVTPGGLVALALVVGGGAGAGAVAFRYLILGFTHLFTGYGDYSDVGRSPAG
jgi:CIC family chloride channel protein